MRWRQAFWCVFVVGVVVASGCTSAATRSAQIRRPSQPFTASDLPAGFELAAVEWGRQFVPWGDDSAGNVGPVTVVAPDGEGPASPRARTVWVTGFQGYQGGLGQASWAVPEARFESFRISGRAAIFVPAQKLPGASRGRLDRSQLVVETGRDLAIEVTGRDATKRELRELAARSTPVGRTTAPRVTAPDGWRSVGRMDSAAVAASDLASVSETLTVDGYQTAGRGNPAVHRLTWVREDATLVATAMPARLGSPAAAAAIVPRAFDVLRSRPVRVAAMRGELIEFVVRGAEPGGIYLRALYWIQDGNLMVVTAFGDGMPAAHELVALARSVRPLSDAAWVAQTPPPTQPPVFGAP